MLLSECGKLSLLESPSGVGFEAICHQLDFKFVPDGHQPFEGTFLAFDALSVLVELTAVTVPDDLHFYTVQLKDADVLEHWLEENDQVWLEIVQVANK